MRQMAESQRRIAQHQESQAAQKIDNTVNDLKEAMQYAAKAQNGTLTKLDELEHVAYQAKRQLQDLASRSVQSVCRAMTASHPET